MAENSPSLEEVIAAARDEARSAGRAAHGSGNESDEYTALMGRLREASAAADAATLEQTLLFAYARTYLMPPPSYQALAEASGMSYSGVRQRLTPEIMEIVRNAGRNALSGSQRPSLPRPQSVSSLRSDGGR